MAKSKDVRKQASRLAHTVLHKVRLTVLVNMLWFLFLVSWIFFYAEQFSIYKNIGIFLISVMVNALVTVYIWILSSYR